MIDPLKTHLPDGSTTISPIGQSRRGAPLGYQVSDFADRLVPHLDIEAASQHSTAVEDR
jgi:hypothetical protein